MQILLIKTSSLGDVIHNLPVISDLHLMLPDARVDWCVEEAFADIPRLHPHVDKVIPVAVRRWRKALSKPATWTEIGDFRKHLRSQQYDAILDTQGLIKSALIARQARGRRYGYASEVAREPLAARFYDSTFIIPPNAHAVVRNRWLSAAAFDYPVDLPLDYGIRTPDVDFTWMAEAGAYSVLFTATSRDDKLWDEANWVEVARSLKSRKLTAIFPSGSERERERAERIASQVPGAIVAPRLGLRDLAALIGKARLTIGVDTGLVHLAAALCVPTIALYITTDPALTGVFGTGFIRNLGAPGRAPTSTEVLTVAEQELRR